MMYFFFPSSSTFSRAKLRDFAPTGSFHHLALEDPFLCLGIVSDFASAIPGTGDYFRSCRPVPVSLFKTAKIEILVLDPL